MRCIWDWTKIALPINTQTKMNHVIEPATSGRAKCRGCGKLIAKEELRFGERAPNSYGDGEVTYWFHLVCGACKRPHEFLSVENADVDEVIRRFAEAGREHHRLSRINLVERARSGRSRCRQCKERIDAETWRLPLEIWEEGRFSPMGFIHAGCCKAYFGTAVTLPRIVNFNPGLSDADIKEIGQSLKQD